MIARFLQPLRRRLILLFAIVLVVPSCFGIVAAIERYNDQLAASREAVSRYATLASNYEANLLWQSEQIASNLMRDGAVSAVLDGNRSAAAQSDCDHVLLGAVKPYPSYGTAVLFDVNGEPLCRWDESREKSNVAFRDWFKSVIRTKANTVSGMVMSRALNEPIIVFAAPVNNADGKLNGVIALGIRLNWLSAIGQEPGLPSNSEIYLFDRDGKVLVAQHPAAGADHLTPIDAMMQRVVAGGEREFEATGRDGDHRIFAVNTIGQNSLYMVLGLPWNEMIRPLQRDLAIQISILSLVSVAGMLAALVGTRLLVTRWTEKLAKAARSMTLGDLAAETELRGAPIEMRQLGDDLRAMAAQIELRETDLRDSLAQKQLMLREIHHRVKNNLQIVTSLLNLYARLPRGDEFKQAFSDLQMRINALALVHRHLYESEDLKEIDFAPFMTNLCNLLQDGSGVSVRRVRLSASFPELRMSGDRAVPLALLTTEILTNSFKHGFPNLRSGSIQVRMTVDASGEAELMISDDGIGPPAGDDADLAITMGSTLIAAFAKQLGGIVTVAGPPGSTTTIRFNLRSLSSEGSEREAGPGGGEAPARDAP
jgi:two-component sensor histidine kinase